MSIHTAEVGYEALGRAVRDEAEAARGRAPGDEHFWLSIQDHDDGTFTVEALTEAEHQAQEAEP